MIKVIAKNVVEVDKIDTFIELARDLVKETRKEEGCIKYEVYQDSHNKKIITFFEEWENSEYLEEHFNTNHFIKIGLKMSELLEKETEINSYEFLI